MPQNTDHRRGRQLGLEFSLNVFQSIADVNVEKFLAGGESHGSRPSIVPHDRHAILMLQREDYTIHNQEENQADTSAAAPGQKASFGALTCGIVLEERVAVQAASSLKGSSSAMVDNRGGPISGSAGTL